MEFAHYFIYLYMKKNVFRILFSVGALILLALVLYSYKKTHSPYALWGKQYKKGLKIIYDKGNYYCTEAQLAFYDSCLRLPSLSSEKIEGLMEWKALSLLKTGNEKAAVDLLEKVVKKCSMEGENEKLISARRELAMAYLRLGEKNNCVSGHSSESCIFPLRNQGVYSDPYASQKAIDLYQKILEADSADLESRWLLNLAYMTIGEYPRGVPAHLLIPGLDKDTSSIQVKPFSDRSTSLGLNNFRSQAGGSIVEDFNNDG
mgnify:CR=1 FL=1